VEDTIITDPRAASRRNTSRPSRRGITDQRTRCAATLPNRYISDRFLLRHGIEPPYPPPPHMWTRRSPALKMGSIQAGLEIDTVDRDLCYGGIEREPEKESDAAPKESGSTRLDT